MPLGKTAVGANNLCVDPATLLARLECDGAGSVFRLAEAFQWCDIRLRLDQFSEVSVEEEIVGDRLCLDRVDLGLPATQLVGQLAGRRLVRMAGAGRSQAAPLSAPPRFADIWMDRLDGEPGCTILTESVHDVAKVIHPRMSLILHSQLLEPGLDIELTDRETISHLIPPSHAQSTVLVNKTGHINLLGRVLISF